MSLNFDCASTDCLDWILINCLLGFQQRTLCHIPRRTQVSSSFTDGFCTYSWDVNEVWCACHWLPNTVKLRWWAANWIALGLSLLGFTLCVAEYTASLACLFSILPACLPCSHLIHFPALLMGVGWQSMLQLRTGVVYVLFLLDCPAQW